MKQPAVIAVRDRFAPLRRELIALLNGLSEQDWMSPTAAPGWSVKDLAAHLLGGDIGILSRERDAFCSTPVEPSTYRELVALVNRLNEEWTVAARRISPRLLCELLSLIGSKVEAHFSTLDLDALGGPVSWAGSDPAPVWFDIAREYTERWHHQQQIRDATGRPALYDPYYFAPVLDTFVRALPHHFRDTFAPVGTVVRVEITGDAGGVWFLHRTNDTWTLALDGGSERPASEVALTQDIAWRLFTNGMDRTSARAQAEIRGDSNIIGPLFTTLAIIG
jgi:uncharacterized protein (TIGR03083 family)